MERIAPLELEPGPVLPGISRGSPRWARVPVALALATLLACDGCQERMSGRGIEEGAAMSEQASGGVEVFPLELGPMRDMPSDTFFKPDDPRLLELEAPVDAANRYLSTVRVTVEFGQERKETCSGALIGRRLVLTAGHCVCQRRQVASEPGTARDLIDGSACVKTAMVQTTLYLPVVSRDQELPARRQHFAGEVRPHPGLRILLDEEGRVASSHADLATLLLEEPLAEEFRPLPLADRDAEINESIVMVGSGHDEVSRRDDEARRSSWTQVTEVLPSGGGRLRIEQPGHYPYKGDSGGPCLREGLEGTALIGVSSRKLGEGGAITSTYEYRDWLREEIHRAETQAPPTRPDL